MIRRLCLAFIFYGLFPSFVKGDNFYANGVSLFMVSEDKDFFLFIFFYLFCRKPMPQWISGIKTHLLGFACVVPEFCATFDLVIKQQDGPLPKDINESPR